MRISQRRASAAPIALLLLVVVIVSAIAVFEWQQMEVMSGQISSLTSKINSLTSANSSLNNTLHFYAAGLNNSQAEYQNLLSNYSRTNTVYPNQALNQSIDIWSVNQTIRAATNGQPGLILWNLLDTFDNNIVLTTNSTVRVMILTVIDYANFRYGTPYTAFYDHTGTHFQVDTPISGGCGIYTLAIINNSNHTVLLTPRVSARYLHTPFLTASCSLG